MIFEALFTLVNLILQAVLGVLPDLPAISSDITDAGDWLIDTTARVVFVPFHLLGVGFTLAMFSAIVALLSFDYLYHFVMWVVRKLPIGAN